MATLQQNTLARGAQVATWHANWRPSAFAAPVRMPDGGILWNWIGIAFIAYWSLFAVGSVTHQQQLNTVGGVLILAVLAWAVLERLWVAVDGVVFASIAAMLIPLVHFITGDGDQSGEAIFKYGSVVAVMAMARLLRLPVAFRSKSRWLVGIPVLMILVLSVLLEHGVRPGSGEGRHSGLFLNPNNLSLIPFLLLFLVDEERDPLSIQIVVHAIVAGMLAYSGTSGAIIAYAIGLAVHLKDHLSLRSRVLVVATLLAAGSIGVLLVVNGGDMLPETRMTTQIEVIPSQLKQALDGDSINFYRQERVSGEGSTSAVWRLAHWRLTLDTYAHGTPEQQLLGFGIGSSTMIFGILPHNEYLRILFEQGIAGLFLFVFAWRRIILTAPQPVRYVALIVAIYSFSENNLDNFPFMSLFILLLSAVEWPLSPGRSEHRQQQWFTPLRAALPE
jgi:hypothetical protein